MNVASAALTDLLILTPLVHTDARGYLFESWKPDVLAAATGRPLTFVQENQARSGHNVLRGLHYQTGTPQAKLVRVLSGTIFNVTVDLRRASPTFGQWFGIEMSAENRRQLFVPEGLAHGFLTLSPESEVLYKITAPHIPERQHVLRYDDATLNIAWPLSAPPVLSEKDQRGLAFADLELFA